MKNSFDVEIIGKSPRKIAIIGHSGSGKSTLAAFLGEEYSLPVLHIDSIHFKPDWAERELEDELSLMRAFMEENDERGWVIDGNYTKLEYERRLEEADLIIYMNFNRWSCFLRAWKRAWKYRNNARPSIAEGCNEKFDRDFRKWILRRGRTKEKLKRYDALVEKYKDKSVVIRNQKELNEFENEIKKQPLQ